MPASRDRRPRPSGNRKAGKGNKRTPPPRDRRGKSRDRRDDTPKREPDAIRKARKAGWGNVARKGAREVASDHDQSASAVSRQAVSRSRRKPPDRGAPPEWQ